MPYFPNFTKTHAPIAKALSSQSWKGPTQVWVSEAKASLASW